MHNKSNDGEAMTLALVGLLIGCVILYINTGEQAQMMANSTGKDASQWEVIKSDPGTSVATVLLPAAAGWGIGYALDKVTGKDSSDSQDTRLDIRGNEAPVTVYVTGNPTTTTRTDTRTDTQTDNSVRQ
jgi:hypothetical protein